MHKKIQEAYDELVPRDQLVVDAIIATLLGKDKEIASLMTEMKKWLEDESKNR